jgi:hypothetical protein
VKYITVGRSSTKNLYTYIYIHTYVQCSASFASSLVYIPIYVRVLPYTFIIYARTGDRFKLLLSRSTYVRSRIYMDAHILELDASDDARPTTDDRLHVVFFFFFCFAQFWTCMHATTAVHVFFFPMHVKEPWLGSQFATASACMHARSRSGPNFVLKTTTYRRKLAATVLRIASWVCSSRQ